MDMTNCPQCGEPAEIFDRHVLESTDGPIEHARVRCLQMHHFFMPVAGLDSGDRVAVRRRRHSPR
jgi:hypothetical protein